MKGLVLAGFIASAVSVSQNAFAASQSMTELGSYTYSSSLGLNEIIIGSTCNVTKATDLGLDCNPAHLANEGKTALRFNLVGTNRLDDINDYRALLNAKDTVGVIDKLHREESPLLAYGSASVWYQREWWAIGYVPFRGGFASLMRNPAYPEIMGDIYKESEWFAKAGFLFEDQPEVHLGVQVRYVDRDFFRQEFALLDAVADPRSLKIEEQHILFVEPGISYNFDDTENDYASVSLTNLPVYRHGAEYEFSPIVDFGFSLAPDFADGRFVTVTHYSNNPDIKDAFRRFRAVMSYDFRDVATLSFIIAKGEVGAAISGNIQSLVLGFGYKLQEYEFSTWKRYQVTNTFFNLGLVF